MSSIVSVLLCQCQAIHSTKKWDLWDLTKHKNLCLECFPKSSIPPPITSLEYPWFTCSGILRSWRLFASRCPGGPDLSGKSNDSMVTLATAQCQEWKWAKNIGFLHFHAVDIQNHEVNSQSDWDLDHHPILINFEIIWTDPHLYKVRCQFSVGSVSNSQL